MSLLSEIHQAHKARWAMWNNLPPPRRRQTFLRPHLERKAWNTPTLSEIDPAVLSARPTIKAIVRKVAEFYDIPLIDVMAHRRTKKITLPRHVAFYLARTLTTRSLPEIGRRMGDRDHTTVLHAFRKIEALRKVDRELDDELNALAGSLSIETTA